MATPVDPIIQQMQEQMQALTNQMEAMRNDTRQALQDASNRSQQQQTALTDTQTALNAQQTVNQQLKDKLDQAHYELETQRAITDTMKAFQGQKKGFDPKLVKQPDAFSGAADDWERFKFSFTSWIGTVDDRYPDLLETAGKQVDELFFEEMETEHEPLARNLFALLVGLCQVGEVPVLAKMVRDRNGLELWRKIFAHYEPGTANKPLVWLRHLSSPVFPTKESEWQHGLEHWESEISQYQAQTNKVFDPDLKLAIIADLAPQNLKALIQMHTKELDSYQKMRQYIVDYLKAKNCWKRPDGNKFGEKPKSSTGPAPMDVGAVGDGKGGKGNKGKKGDGKADGQKPKKGDGHKGDGTKGDGKGKADDKGPCAICGPNKGKNHTTATCFFNAKKPKGDGKGGGKKGKGTVGAVQEAPDAYKALQDQMSSLSTMVKNLSSPTPSVVSAGPSASQRGSAMGAIGEGPAPSKPCSSEQMMFAISAESGLVASVLRPGELAYMMVDSGAVESVTPPGTLPGQIDHSKKRDLYGITGQPLRTTGKLSAPVSLEKSRCDGSTVQQDATFGLTVADTVESVMALANILDQANCDVHFLRGEQSYLENDAGERFGMERFGKRWYLPFRARRPSSSSGIVAATGDVPAVPPSQEDHWPELELFDPDKEAELQAIEEEEIPDEMSLEDLMARPHVPQQPVAPGVPVRPDPAEVELHNLHHAEFAAWCPHCVSGRAPEDPHKRQPERDGDWSLVQMDFQFFNREGQVVERESALATCLSAKCASTGYPLLVAVPSKARSIYVVRSLVIYLQRLAHAKIMLQHDGEPAIRAIAEAAQKELGRDKLQLRESPRESHQSLGHGEGSNSQMAGMIRTWLGDLNARYAGTEIPIDVNHPVFPWLAKHVSWLWARYHVQSDGMTPYRAIHGKDYSAPIVPFGETILCKVPDLKSQSKARPRWYKCVFVGRLELNDQVVALTPNGAFTVRSMRRLPDLDEKELLDSVQGLPWAPKTGKRTKVVADKSVIQPALPAQAPATPPEDEGSGNDSDEYEPSELGEPGAGTETPRAPPAAASPAPSSSDSSSDSGQGAKTPPVPTLTADQSETAGLGEPGTPPPDKRPAWGSGSSPSSPPRGAGVSSSSQALPSVPAFPGKISSISDATATIQQWACSADWDQQMSSVVDFLDTQLDPKEVAKARDEQMRTLIEKDFAVPYLRTQVPKGSKIFGHKWVDEKKRGVYRSRFTCADIKRRYSKEELLAEVNTFCPTPYEESHTLLEIKALKNGWPLRSGDIRCAFLLGRDSGDSSGEAVFIRPSPEYMPYFESWLLKQDKWTKDTFKGVGVKDLALKLTGNLYGRRPAGCTFRDEFEKVVVGDLCSHGYEFKRGKRDATVYTCARTDATVIHHVDDTRATAAPEILDHLHAKTGLGKYLDMKVGAKNEVPGTKVDNLGRTKLHCDDCIITIPDDKHVSNMIELLQLEDAKPSKIASKKISHDADVTPLSPEQKKIYQSAVGSAIFYSSDRRDVRFEVKELARHMSDPRSCDWDNLLLLTRYLKWRRTVGRITQVNEASKKGPLTLDGFSDSDWGACIETRRSTDCVIVNVAGTTAIAHTQTQPGLPATSSGEAETRGLGRLAREVLFVKQLAEEDFGLEVEAQPRLWTDASTALQTAKRLGAGSKMRHLEVSHFLVQELVKTRKVKIGKVAGPLNPANCLTKHLDAKLKAACLEDLGMVDMSEESYRELLSAAEEIKLIASIGPEMARRRQPTPWKPNFALAASFMQIVAAHECMKGAMAAGNPLAKKTATSLITNLIAPPTESQILGLAVFLLCISLMVYGAIRLIMDIRGCCFNRTPKEITFEDVIISQTGMAHLRECAALKIADRSKCKTHLTCSKCKVLITKQIRDLYVKEKPG